MILVTGANGFLGKHLLELLCKNNNSIKATYRTNKPRWGNDTNFVNVNWVKCDMLDVDEVQMAMQQITQVYHCANSISFETKDAQEMFHNNVDGTANVVNACLENNNCKLCYVSSVAAIARAGNGKLIAEKTPWLQDGKTSAYGISKYKAEMEVWRGIAEGLKAVIVNPSVIIGEGDWTKGSSQIFKTVYNEFPFYTNGVNGFVDVKDVANAMHLLMNSNIENERFIINQGNYTYKEVFTKIANSFGKKPPPYLASKWLSNIVWRLLYLVKLLTGKTPLITKETSSTANSIYEYDNSKLLATNIGFTYNNIDASIQRVCEYYALETQEKK